MQALERDFIIKFRRPGLELIERNRLLGVVVDSRPEKVDENFRLLVAIFERDRNLTARESVRVRPRNPNDVAALPLVFRVCRAMDPRRTILSLWHILFSSHTAAYRH